MKQEERASIIRVVSDLIKADGIIDTREIDFLDDLRKDGFLSFRKVGGVVLYRVSDIRKLIESHKVY